MSVSDEDIRMIEASLPLVRAHFEPASEQFYETLFAMAPELRALFRSDLAGQGMRFLMTLATIAELIDEPEALDAEVAVLAKAHARIGVKPEDFVPMEAALMVTLGETLGTDFTPAMQRAWRHAFDVIAERMLAAGFGSQPGAT